MLPYRCVSPQCAMPLCQSYTRFDACPVSCLRCMSPCSTPVLLLSLLSPGSRPVSAGSLCCKLVLALRDFKPTQASCCCSQRTRPEGCEGHNQQQPDQFGAPARRHARYIPAAGAGRDGRAGVSGAQAGDAAGWKHWWKHSIIRAHGKITKLKIARRA